MGDRSSPSTQKLPRGGTARAPRHPFAANDHVLPGHSTAHLTAVRMGGGDIFGTGARGGFDGRRHRPSEVPWELLDKVLGLGSRRWATRRSGTDSITLGQPLGQPRIGPGGVTEGKNAGRWTAAGSDRPFNLKRPGHSIPRGGSHRFPALPRRTGANSQSQQECSVQAGAHRRSQSKSFRNSRVGRRGTVNSATSAAVDPRSSTPEDPPGAYRRAEVGRRRAASP